MHAYHRDISNTRVANRRRELCAELRRARRVRILNSRRAAPACARCQIIANLSHEHMHTPARCVFVWQMCVQMHARTRRKRRARKTVFSNPRNRLALPSARIATTHTEIAMPHVYEACVQHLQQIRCARRACALRCVRIATNLDRCTAKRACAREQRVGTC